jgi:hypothetical protein
LTLKKRGSLLEIVGRDFLKTISSNSDEHANAVVLKFKNDFLEYGNGWFKHHARA